MPLTDVRLACETSVRTIADVRTRSSPFNVSIESHIWTGTCQCFIDVTYFRNRFVVDMRLHNSVLTDGRLYAKCETLRRRARHPSVSHPSEHIGRRPFASMAIRTSHTHLSPCPHRPHPGHCDSTTWRVLHDPCCIAREGRLVPQLTGEQPAQPWRWCASLGSSTRSRS